MQVPSLTHKIMPERLIDVWIKNGKKLKFVAMDENEIGMASLHIRASKAAGLDVDLKVDVEKADGTKVPHEASDIWVSLYTPKTR